MSERCDFTECMTPTFPIPDTEYGVHNSSLDGLIHSLTPRLSSLRRLAKSHPPDASWYTEEDQPKPEAESE